MNKKIYLLFAAALLSASAMGQNEKLSPTMRLVLANSQQTTSSNKNNPQKVYSKIKNLAPVNEKDNTIGAFLRIDNPQVVDQLKAKGVKIGSVISDSLVTVTMPLDKVYEIAETKGVRYVQAATKAKLLMDQARKDTYVDQAQSETNGLGSFTGKGIVIGIVDTGFYTDHVGFYSKDRKSFRIKKYWQQDQWPGEIYKSPEGFNYGRELADSVSITRMHYDLSGYSHATHVAGIASGADIESGLYGVAPDAELVIVSTDLESNHVVDGVKYCFDYAKSVGKPCVVNLSIGNTLGPRDGTSECDEALNALTGPGRIIVGASGNDGAYLLHASKQFSDGDNQMNTVFNCSYGNTAVGEIWGTKGQNLAVKAQIVDINTGEVISKSDVEDTASPKGFSVNLDKNCAIQIASEVNPSNNRPHVQVVANVSYLADNQRLVLSIKGDDGGEAHVWAVQNSAIEKIGKEGYTDGDNRYTVNEIGGTPENVISVGAYNTREKAEYIDGSSYDYSSFIGKIGDISNFSSCGPTLDGRQKPDVAAPGAEIYSTAVEDGYGSFDAKSQATKKVDYNGKTYYYFSNQGTSMSSPLVAGVVALWLQENPNMAPDDVRTLIEKSSRCDEGTGELPNYRFGYGKIDAMQGLRILANTTGIKDIRSLQQLFKIAIDRDSKNVTVYYDDNIGKANVEVFNSVGQKVHGATIASSGSTIDLSTLGKGVFIIKLHVGNANHSVKITL